MKSEIPVKFESNSLAPTEQESLDNTAKTSLRERSMEAENNYPGIQTEGESQ